MLPLRCIAIAIAQDSNTTTDHRCVAGQDPQNALLRTTLLAESESRKAFRSRIESKFRDVYWLDEIPHSELMSA
jgi:hypothetical protein